MTSYKQLKQLALDLGQPGHDPVGRLHHFAAIFKADTEADPEQWIATSTVNVYADGVKTGIQLKDLLYLSKLLKSWGIE